MSAEEYARRANEVLHSMEASFLSILAEHHQGDDAPKDEGAPSASSAGTSTGGKAEVTVRASEAAANWWMDCLIHYRSAGCLNCADHLANLCQDLVVNLLSVGIANHGWDQGES